MKDIALTPRTLIAGSLIRLTSTMMALLLGLLLTVGPTMTARAQQDAGKTGAKAKKQKGPAAPKKDILVFPADTKGGPSDQLSGIITDVVKARLEASEAYQATTFSVAAPTFRRALSEQTLTPKDVKPPYDSNAKVQKLIQFAGYNYAVTASVDDYDYDAAKQQVNIVLTVTFIDFSSGKPQPRPFGDSASTAAKAVKDASDTAPVINLARELTEKIMTELLKPAKPATK